MAIPVGIQAATAVRAHLPPGARTAAPDRRTRGWRRRWARKRLRRRDESLTEALDRMAWVDGSVVVTWNLLTVTAAETDALDPPAGAASAVRLLGSPHWHRIT